VAPDLRSVAGAVARGIGTSLLPAYACAEGLASGKIVVDMSSISPIETKEFAKRINDQHLGDTLQFIHDNPRFLAGHNLGPVAEEHLVGVMITCLTHIYEIQASQRGLAIDSLRLENEAILSPRLGSIGNPPRYLSINYKVIIGSPETKEAIEQLQKAVESICPVYNLLKDSQPIKGTIVRGPFKEKARVAGN